MYIGTTSGGETLQGSTIGTASFIQSTALTAGAAPPTTYNTICKIVANDAMYPLGTGYTVALTNAAGNSLPIVAVASLLEQANSKRRGDAVSEETAKASAEKILYRVQKINGDLSDLSIVRSEEEMS